MRLLDVEFRGKEYSTAGVSVSGLFRRLTERHHLDVDVQDLTG